MSDFKLTFGQKLHLADAKYWLPGFKTDIERERGSLELTYSVSRQLNRALKSGDVDAILEMDKLTVYPDNLSHHYGARTHAHTILGDILSNFLSIGHITGMETWFLAVEKAGLDVQNAIKMSVMYRGSMGVEDIYAVALKKPASWAWLMSDKVQSALDPIKMNQIDSILGKYVGEYGSCINQREQRGAIKRLSEYAENIDGKWFPKEAVIRGLNFIDPSKYKLFTEKKLESKIMNLLQLMLIVQDIVYRSGKYNDDLMMKKAVDSILSAPVANFLISYDMWGNEDLLAESLSLRLKSMKITKTTSKKDAEKLRRQALIDHHTAHEKCALMSISPLDWLQEMRNGNADLLYKTAETFNALAVKNEMAQHIDMYRISNSSPEVVKSMVGAAELLLNHVEHARLSKKFVNKKSLKNKTDTVL